VERGAYEKLLVGVEKDFSISKCTRLFQNKMGIFPTWSRHLFNGMHTSESSRE
jgi:hypothetical protein